MFITFEGCEGSGKSTQARLLAEYLKKNNFNVTLTREPGGTQLAEDLRNILLSGEIVSDPLTEFLILCAARRDHVENKIKPALNDGAIVISDRFIDSSIAYQGYGKGLSFDKMEQITRLSIENFQPEVTFLIDIDPSIAIDRITKNRSSEQNSYDKMDLAFHTKIRDGFLEIAKNNRSRIKVLDGTKTEAEIHQEALSILSSKM